MTQDPQVTSRRREIARAVADVSQQHQLPMPMTLEFSRGGERLQLRLDDNDRDGVVRWAAALGTAAVTTSEPMSTGSRTFVSVSSETRHFSGPTWMGLANIYVWSACDVPANGEQA